MRRNSALQSQRDKRLGKGRGRFGLAEGALEFGNRGEQIEGDARFFDAAVRAGSKDDGPNVRTIVMADNENAGLRQFLTNKPSGFETAHSRHTDIEKNQVGEQFARHADSLKPIASFTADFPLLPVRQRRD
jgi:hypothetical protein